MAGQVNAWLRPDGRCFVYFDTWQSAAYQPLADAVARDLSRDLYVSLEDTEFDALDACAAAGFAEHRRESYFRIPTNLAASGLAGVTLSDELDLLSAADADIGRLRLLDDALRQDVPGADGWRWDPDEFRAETFGRSFDPATYLVAERANGEYAGLVRVWMSRRRAAARPYRDAAALPKARSREGAAGPGVRCPRRRARRASSPRLTTRMSRPFCSSPGWVPDGMAAA